MTDQDPRYARLVELLNEVVHLRMIWALLFWDQQAMMPRAGAEARGSQLAAIKKVGHEKFTSPEVGELLEELRGYEASLPYDSDQASTIRVARREYGKQTRLPADLVVRRARAEAAGLRAWLASREAKDYKLFRAALETMVDVMREEADAFGWEDHPLDPILDRGEPGMKIAEVEALFGELRETLVPLVKAISEKAGSVDDSFLHLPYDTEKQVEASREAVRAIGFDLDARGRMDFSVHPYTVDVAPPVDVRITTRVKETFPSQCFFASLHEAGHGTYAQGIPARFLDSILNEGASGGIHESQSRLWENLVGRSREFWQFFYPRFQEYFPSQLGGITLETFYRAVNKVAPSFIRVEADEVTYNLHIMIRFELEKAVFDRKLAVADLGEAWKAKFKEYLGLTPPDDLLGVLQDIHWSSGFGASFVSYTIGNVSSVQFYEKAKTEIPDLERGFARGKYRPLLEWMNENVHAWGSKLKPQELLKKVTGEPLNPKPYLGYIKRKFGEIYGL